MYRFLALQRPVLLLGLFLISSLALSFSPLLSSQANALSKFDGNIRSTKQISITNATTGANIDISDDQGENSWRQLFLNAPYCGNAQDRVQALLNGTVSVSQYYSTAKKESVYITWTTEEEKQLPANNFFFYDNDNFGGVFKPSGVNSLSIYLNEYGINVHCGYDYEQQYISTTANTNNVLGGVGAWIYFTNYKITYPNAYEGEIPPTEPGNGGTYPEFGYTINSANDIVVNYLRNLDLAITGNTGYTWRYQMFKADPDYNKQGAVIDTKYLPLVAPYNYHFDQHGQYLLEIDLQVAPPAALRPEIKKITLKLNVNGQFYGGSTKDCEDGVCQPPETTCDVYLGSIERMTCVFNRTVNIGVLNPTINAFKGIFTSVTVPENPQCVIPISDINISGKTFPLSDFDNNACSATQRMHDAFPIMSVLVNFGIALSTFYLIGRLINKLTDNNDHKIVEGV